MRTSIYSALFVICALSTLSVAGLPSTPVTGASLRPGKSGPPTAQGASGSLSVDFNADMLRATVIGIAEVIGREYMDPAVGDRVAESLRQRLKQGQYASATTPEALAADVTRDLLSESQDKHLAVAVVRDQGPRLGQATGANARQEAVRRSNGGVQRVEILSGNVGYLNLTAFWRVEEARDAIADAMRLLRRADALIIDVRQNGGGSPGTVALLASYLFDQGELPLFDIVSRSGDRVAYATQTPGLSERDQRRPLYVLTAPRTFSAAEGFAFLLQERKRAEVIGARTAGAANPGQPYRVNPLFEVTVPNGRVRSAVSGSNWEGSGVTPDVTAAESDALKLAHSRALGRLSRP